jgi:dTDP-glucose 4,6-dehydratase
MSVIVTGGAGFIGSTLVDRLLAAGERVVTIDSLSYAGSRDNLGAALAHPAHRFVRADIRDAAAMRAAVREARPRAVFHLAAETHVDRSIDDPAAFVSTNLGGTASLLEAALAYWRGLDGAARQRFRFVHVSTDEVYGALGAAGVFAEASAYAPSSPYAATKAGADHLARAWHRTYGLPAIVSNCGNNYGPRQFPEKLIPLTVLRALDGQTLPVYGRGENVRDWIWADDHAAALQAIAARGRPGETYLVGARCERRNIDVVRALCAILDDVAPAGAPHARRIEFVGDRPGHDLRYAIDPTKIEAELGWRPRQDFESGLRRTVEWYVANVAWCRRTRETYKSERLGLRAGDAA